ncbi:MAG: tRNA pseudouridine(38-40) synthase TruA [Desulfobulbaceae bacterium]|jgi:tRNA pseudouridine38-40 synthase|nr:tRNA pseudouridine(38-40) synthase TruA [Desulfobulbaceae bacterium]
MRTVKLLISFDGCNYCGWQRQNNQITIQGAIEEQLARICNEPVVLHGAGRTDAGVHAYGMVAHFHTGSRVSCYNLLSGLNSLLHTTIRILAVDDVPESFHARKSAMGKQYWYFFSRADVLVATRVPVVAHFPKLVHLDRMHQCLPLLLGTHDFSSFEAVGSRDLALTSGRGAERTLTDVHIEPSDPRFPDEFKLVLHGDGFLRKMVRNIAGTLFEVGLGRMTIADFSQVMQARNRQGAGPTAPACGLFLNHVEYRLE